MKCVNLLCPGAHTDHGGRPAKEIPTAGVWSGLWDGARASMEGALPLVWGQPQPAPTGMYAISHQRCHPGHLICASVNVICFDFFCFETQYSWWRDVSHELGQILLNLFPEYNIFFLFWLNPLLDSVASHYQTHCLHFASTWFIWDSLKMVNNDGMSSNKQ